MLDRLLVILRGNLSLVLDSDTTFAYLLHLLRCHGALLVVKHRLFYCLLLVDGLLLQTVELVPRLALLANRILVLVPDRLTLL